MILSDEQVMEQLALSVDKDPTIAAIQKKSQGDQPLKVMETAFKKALAQEYCDDQLAQKKYLNTTAA